MFDFNSTIEDIKNNINNISNDIIVNNSDIRCAFYGKYKILLELEPVKNSEFYKITNISETACYSNSSYIIPVNYFEYLIDFKIDQIIQEFACDNSYKEVYEKYRQLINTTQNAKGALNNINIYQDDVFEFVYLYGYDREKTNGNVTVFIRFKEDLNLDILNNLNSNNEFYNILNNINNKGVFDLRYYTNIINKRSNSYLHPLFLELLNRSYIKFYKDINNSNKFYFLFNYKKLYSYMKDDGEETLNTIIKYAVGFNIEVAKITEFNYLSENIISKNEIFKNDTHTVGVTLTNKIKKIPEYVLNTVLHGDLYTNNIGMYEITIIN